MPSVPSADFGAEVEAARGRIRSDADFRIEGSDADSRALDAARANISRAGLEDRIELKAGRAEDALPGYDKGILICNPPYGERLGTVEASEELYRDLGRTAASFGGWGLGFVTNRSDFADFFGERSPSKHKIMNGAEEQWFHWYPADRSERGGRAPGGNAGQTGGRDARKRTRG
jgi:putative N6-adenine-specific DNA methylase